MDTALFKWINRMADHTGWAHGPAEGYATYGIGLFAVLLLAAWWDARGTEESPTAVAAVAWAGVAPLLSFVAVQIIGSAVDRARPTAAIPNMHLLLDRTDDFSFPSDHSTAVAAIAVGLLLAGHHLRHRWYGWVAAGAGVVLGFTRVYVGAHYPGDVVAGFALGGVIAAGLAPLARRALEPIARWCATSPLAPLVMSSRAEPRP